MAPRGKGKAKAKKETAVTKTITRETKKKDVGHGRLNKEDLRLFCDYFSAGIDSIVEGAIYCSGKLLESEWGSEQVLQEIKRLLTSLSGSFIDTIRDPKHQREEIRKSITQKRFVKLLTYMLTDKDINTLVEWDILPYDRDSLLLRSQQMLKRIDDEVAGYDSTSWYHPSKTKYKSCIPEWTCDKTEDEVKSAFGPFPDGWKLHLLTAISNYGIKKAFGKVLNQGLCLPSPKMRRESYYQGIRERRSTTLITSIVWQLFDWARFNLDEEHANLFRQMISYENPPIY